jgi:hypothetical protein
MCVLAVGCPNCREQRDLRIESLLINANRVELVGRFLIRPWCGVCRSPPETIRLKRRAGEGA